MRGAYSLHISHLKPRLTVFAGKESREQNVEEVGEGGQGFEA